MARVRLGWVAVMMGLVVVAGLGVAVALRHRGPDLSDARLAVFASKCGGLARSARMACYREVLTEQLRRESVGAAMETLEALAKADNDVDRDGHVLAHGIGIEAYLHERSVAKTFSQCPTTFSSGCGHGILQAYLESLTSIDGGQLNDVCAPYRKPGSAAWVLFQCVHGIGHGLDMMYGGDLPRALDSCDLLVASWENEACYGGAFMENIMGEIMPHHPASELATSHHHAAPFKRLDPADPLYPCSIMPERRLPSCYGIQTAAILRFTKNDIAKAATICDGAPAGMQRMCYMSLGRDLTSRSRRDPAKTKRLCDEASESNRSWCYLGAAKALIDWRADSGDGMAFCSLLEGGRGVLVCYRGVGEQIASLVALPAERARRCAAAKEEKSVAACRYGAGVPGSRPPRDDS
ncbi:MAG: hypothetical protein ABI647_13235 [Gemmatimonadota bacterium]